MKIRIRDNSVRFRLTQTEVKQLAANGEISGQTQFIDRAFVYAVQTTAHEELSASFIDNKVVLYLPERLASTWVTSDEVGFDGQVGELKLLIEKDFVCIDNSTEDQSDNYPNPHMNC